MQEYNSYVYFALTGENIDPAEITSRIGITPTDCWRKGEMGKYQQILESGMWELSTSQDQKSIYIDYLIDDLISGLFDKIQIINDLKKQYQLESVLEVVLYIDMNEDNSTPALGYGLKVIEFLYRTQTSTDVDIYRFNSAANEKN